jgi:hypothetical protein
MPGIARHTPTLAGNRAVRLLVIDTALLPHFGEAIGALSLASEWVEIEDPISDVVDSAMASLIAYYDNLMIGSVSSWLIPPPPGWLLLDGTTHDKVDYPELWAALPEQLKSGSDFTLPDTASTFQAGTTVEDDIGDEAGANTFALTVAQLPAHDHTYTNPIPNIDLEAPGVPDIVAAGVGPGSTTGLTGSGDEIDNRPEHVLFMFAIYAGRE